MCCVWVEICRRHNWGREGRDVADGKVSVSSSDRGEWWRNRTCGKRLGLSNKDKLKALPAAGGKSRITDRDDVRPCQCAPIRCSDMHKESHCLLTWRFFAFEGKKLRNLSKIDCWGLRLRLGCSLCPSVDCERREALSNNPTLSRSPHNWSTTERQQRSRSTECEHDPDLRISYH